MTLFDVIRILEITASHQPAVNMIVENDIFRLNQAPQARYGVFAWVQGQHTGSTEGPFMSYQFNLFFVDRLKNDLSNQVEIQSNGIQTIDNILKQVAEKGLYIDSYTFTSFNQRFVDECAGVFCNVTIQVPANDFCSENFADFNDDFNDDFMIY